MLHLEEKIKNEIYIVSLNSTGIIVGEFVKIDGFYYFSKNKNRTWGYWSQEFLTALSNELRELNSMVNESIEEYFNSEKIK
jgi:hypothetical protein